MIAFSKVSDNPGNESSGYPQKMRRIIKELARLWDNKISILLYEKVSCLYSDNRI